MKLKKDESKREGKGRGEPAMPWLLTVKVEEVVGRVTRGFQARQTARHRERARERAQSYTLCVSHSPPFFNGASYLLLRKMAGRIEISSSSIQEVGWKRWGSVPVFGKRMELWEGFLAACAVFVMPPGVQWIYPDKWGFADIASCWFWKRKAVFP